MSDRDERANLNTWVRADLVQAVKVRAAMNGVKVQDIVEQALLAYLSKKKS